MYSIFCMRDGGAGSAQGASPMDVIQWPEKRIMPSAEYKLVSGDGINMVLVV
jgi:hypothetical protein